MAIRSFFSRLRGPASPETTKRSGRVLPGLERLEARTVPAAIPTVTLAPPSVWADAPRNQVAIYPPATSFIGEQTHMVLTFDNTSPIDAGYGPYIDLFVPKTGADGVGTAVDDGITFASATYLGLPVTSTVITLTAAGVNHPYAVDPTGKPLVIKPPANFKEGDQLVVLQLPFGSFTNDQPVASIDVALNISNLADLGTPLPLLAQGGFQYGNDPLNNPQSDPTLVGTAVSSSVTPELFRLLKEYIGPEDETATGPNFPRQYKLRVDVANGQTLTNLQIRDILDSSMQFLKVDSVTGGAIASSSLPSITIPGGTLLETLASVTGSTGIDDATVTFSFYVPYFDSANLPTVPVTGQPQPAVDNAQAEGDWTPIDTRDAARHVVSASDSHTTHTLTERSLAIQKTVRIVDDQSSLGYTPGDTIEYTLHVQVSDYFAFQNLAVSDILPDGLSVDGSFTPTLELREHGVTSNLLFSGNTFSAVANPSSGTDLLVFNVSQLLQNNGQDGILLGGNVPDGGTGGPLPQSNPAINPGTIAFIRFRAKIDNTYQKAQLSGSNVVVPGDWLVNHASITGDLLNVANLVPTTNTVTDTTAEEIRIVSLPNSKTVYAVNGNTSFTLPVQILPGDTVTYRLTTSLAFSSFTNLNVTDYLPLPLFHAAEVTRFSPVVSSTAPVAGTICYAPGDTFHSIIGITPTVSHDAIANSFQLNYGDHNDPDNDVTTIDLLVTVSATDEPMADRLFLTNQFEKSQIDSGNNAITANTLVQVQVLTPSVLGVRKGVVATSNSNGVFSPAQVAPTGVTFNAPGTAGSRFAGTITSANLGSTLNSNLSKVDASDLATFVISLENKGSSPKGAFDVRLRDTIPTGFSAPTGGAGLNLRVTDGAGNLLPYKSVGAGFFGTGPNDGIELVDGSSIGAIAPGKNLDGTPINNGKNIVLVTYDLVADPTVEASKTYTNTATVFNYASVEAGPDYTPNDFTDTATVTLSGPVTSKTVVGTEFNATGAFRGVIGELVTYTAKLTIPEGVTNTVRLVDTLDAGLAFVDIVTATASSSLSIPAARLVPTVTNNGHTVTFDFGNITNTDTNNAVAETVEITYRAVVLNVVGNQSGTQLGNSIKTTWNNANTSNPTDTLSQTSTPTQKITVVEPALDIRKSVSVNGNGGVGEGSEPVSYTIAINNPSAFTAWEVDITDPLPFLAGSGSLILSPTVTLIDSDGMLPANYLTIGGDAATGYHLEYNPGNTGAVPRYFDFLVSKRVITITIDGILAPYVPVGGFINNTATTTWTSLDGNPGARSTYNPNSTERTGADGVGGTLNDYADSSSAGIQVPSGSTKSLISTSEADTPGSQVAIGEIARYRLAFEIAQGATTNLQFHDNLPAGMQFLNDGTAMVALVSASGTAFTGGIASPATQVAASNANSVVPTFVLPDSAVSSTASTNNDSYGNGSDVYFSFGNLTNTDTNITQKEYVIVEFNALVMNVSANQAGTSLANTFDIFSGGAQIGTTSNPTIIDVMEPSVSIAKTTGTATGDAGDRVEYTLLVVNATGSLVAPAHNILVTDLLPAELLLDTNSVKVEKVSGFASYINRSTSGKLDVEVLKLLPGEGVKITYTAVVQNGVNPGQIVTNNAHILYTTLPGTGTNINPTGSVTPGVSGATDGQRDGSGGVNDYNGSSTASFAVNRPTIGKTIAASSLPQTGSSQFNPSQEDIAPGEIVSYRLTVTLVEGTQRVLVADAFPAGNMTFDSARVDVIGAGITNTAGLSVGSPASYAGGMVTFDFGSVTVPGDNDESNNLIEILVFGKLDAGPAVNASGSVVINSVTLDYGDPDKPSSSVAFDVVEPRLSIQKTNDSPQVDAGDTVTYTLVVSHTNQSTSAAFQNIVTDLLPIGLSLIVGSVTVSDSTAEVQIGNTPGDTSVGILISEILLGQTVTITYQARVTGLPTTTVRPGDQILNTAIVEGSSVPREGGRPTVDSDQSVVTLNSSALSGYAYHDVDGNRTFGTGAGDLPLAGVIISLTGTDILGNPVTATTTTDANGWYQFANLAPGTYSLTEIQPTGYVSNGEQPGSPFAVTNPVMVENILQAFIPAGSNTTGHHFNFAEVQPGSIAGTVYVDTNDNGIINTGELGIPGVAIQLTGTDLYGRPVSTSFTTDLNGGYSFTGLLAGNYTVTETNQPFYLDGQDTPGNLGGNNTINEILSNIILPPAGIGTGYNFGERQTQSTKSLVHGLLPATPGSLVAIGEVVRYRLVFTLPQSTATNLVFQENLPAGMLFLNDGSATVALVAPVSGLLTGGLAGSDPGSVVIASGATGVVPVYLMPGGAISSNFSTNEDNYSDGTDVFFQLGALANTDRDAARAEYVIVEFNARVLDVSANQPGDQIDNTFTVFNGNSPTDPVGDPSNIVTVDVVDPDLQISKTANGQRFDAGDTVIFTIVLDHTGLSTSTAFNALVTDALATGLKLVPGSVTVSDAAAVVQQGNGLGDLAIRVLVPELPLGQSVTVTYQAIVVGFPVTSVRPGDQVTNTARSSSSSVPDAHGRVDNVADDEIITLNSNALSGFVYHDIDGNRTFGAGAGDLPLAGVIISLTGADNLGNPVTTTTTTDANGWYQFANLAPGTYSLTEIQPTGYVSNGEQPGSPFAVTNPVMVENVLAALIPKGSNNNGLNFNFAEVLPGGIGGSVYSDLNNNGLREAAETGLPGVVMQITGTDLYGRPVSATVITESNGGYLFGALLAGEYMVTETMQPKGYLDGKDTPGSLGGDNSVNERLSGIVLPAAGYGTGYNFGELVPASLNGQVYMDLNRNGQRDPADLPLVNVPITLQGTDDLGNLVNLNTTTDKDGNYRFDNLRPGVYEVIETQPAGYMQGETQPGSDGGTVPTHDLIQSVVLNPGADAIAYDFTELGKPADPVTPLPPPVLPPVISKQQYLASSPDQSWVFNAPLQPHFSNFEPNGAMGSAAFVVTGSGAGSGIVRVFDYGQDNERFRFQPYGTSAVGVRVAKGDVTGDGVPDFVTVPTGGFASMVHIYDGNNGYLVRSFNAYPGFMGGLWVAVGDLNGDGIQEVVTGTDVGVEPHVVAFDAATGTAIHSFLAYAPTYLGGVRVAVGDLDGNGLSEIITSAGAGASPHIVYFDGLTAATLLSFYAFAPAYLGGTQITAGDTNGDGRAEVIACSGPNAGGGSLYVFNGAGTMLLAKSVSDAVFGMDVGTQDINVDGIADIIVSRNARSGPFVEILDGLTLNVLDDFFADDPRFTGGISVA